MPPYPILATDEARPVRGLPIRSIRERRLGEFIGGQFAQYNLTSLLFEGRRHDKDVIKLERWDPPGESKPSFDEAVRQTYRPLQIGDSFGPSWTNHWVHVTIRVPHEWQSKEWLQLEFDPGCEAMIFSQDGIPLQGITGGYGADRRVDFPLEPKMRSGKVEFWIEVSANGMFGLPSDGQGGDPDPNRFFTLDSAALVVKRPEAWKLLWDFTALRGCVDEMPRNGVLQNKALWVANEIQNCFRGRDIGSIDRCRKLAEEVLGKHWEQSGERVYEEESKTDTLVWALGHCHIDSCWLWPRSVTQQKVARSWSTQLALMERFPEHRFVASQAAQFQWMEQLYPKLFKRIQEAVSKGSFLPIGGTWVENDANLPSGEAFVRQLLFGQRFYLTRFGARSNIFWLPDTFGYNAQIPQLARSAGLDFFFTQKLSWNNVNKFPHSTVMWQGLDGSQILTHFSPVENYDSQCGVNDVLKAVRNNQNLDVQPSGLLLYGFGDGGGGATESMMNNLRRARAIHNAGFHEMPRVKVAESAQQFFEHVLEKTDKGSRLPTWTGDLYLEFHRGVYTSHGSIKRWNRKLEILLHNVEWVCTLVSISDPGYEYPKEKLDKLWETLLFNQFHDILPGSSIRRVYDDAEKDYAEIQKQASKILAHAQAFAAKKEYSAATSLNTLAIPRKEFVTSTPNGELTLAFDYNGDGIARILNAPSASSILDGAVSVQGSHNAFILQSNLLSVTVENGRVTSIKDIPSRRELLAPGRTMGLSIYEDYPPAYDAWETEIYSLDTEEEITFSSVRIQEASPWRASLALEASFGRSRATVVLTLDALPASQLTSEADARSALRVDVEVDWMEKHRFLRLVVPTALRSDVASYETQFGITKRPTHRNTSWDAAKFEACAHRFVDLSESNYGCALVSDCKYGFSVEGGTMRASLLKAGTYPDAHQDEGKHVMSFAVYPHANVLENSDVIHFARIFNNPMEHSPASLQTLHALVTLSGDTQAVVLDTIKRGESDFDYYTVKGSGRRTVIIRFYEAVGSHAKVVLHTSHLRISSITETNILEDDLSSLTVDSQTEAAGLKHRLPLSFRPFEVKTVKLTLA